MINVRKGCWGFEDTEGLKDAGKDTDKKTEELEG